MLVVAPPSGMGTRNSRLTFLDLEGLETPLPLGPRRFGAARLSPDGKRIVYMSGSSDAYRVNVRPRVRVVLNRFDEIEQRIEGTGNR